MLTSSNAASSSTKFGSTKEAELRYEMNQMRVRELKEELKTLRISFHNVFDKEGLVDLLMEARMNGSSVETETDAIVVPMSFYSLESGISVAAANANDVYLRPSPGKFAAIALDVAPDSSLDQKINMLVDTACTAVVLRPEVVRRLNLSTYGAGATMTAAGGGSMTGALTQLQKFTLAYSNESKRPFGPLPTAVQDIGALPSQLDGIIGLSFLNQFACVDFDFRRGKMLLHENDMTPNIDPELKFVGEASLFLTRMQVWAANIYLDGRGPVKMLVDTGAASSILNWKGVSDMGLSRSSPYIQQNVGAIGAMGADNVALNLSHRYVLTDSFGLQESMANGVVLKDDSINLDIGDLPILETLRADGIGGLLGSDFLMRCDLVRFQFRGTSTPRISLFMIQ